MTWVTGSTGSPGHMVLGSLGRWVTKCDPVPCLLATPLLEKGSSYVRTIPVSMRTKYEVLSFNRFMSHWHLMLKNVMVT